MRVIILVVLLFASFSPLNSQETSKPQISKVTMLPSEPVIPSGDCKASTGGYLEMKDGRTKLNKTELGNFLDASLRAGYIVTIYPQTKRGIFVNMECINALKAQ